MGAARQEQKAYRKLVGVLRHKRGRATVADLAAETALPLDMVGDLANAAADEYSGRLEVTQSGEILYSFPRGFISRYRGFRVSLRRAAGKCGRALRTAGTWIFKVWIMVMLAGYFTLFVALSLLLVFVSIAGSRSNRSSDRDRGGVRLDFSIFSFLMRMWFYSELTRSPYRSCDSRSRNRAYQGRSSGGKKPLYQAIFSFVFGDGDPNAGWEDREKKTVLAYIQAHNGVITLGEFMILTGKDPSDAQRDISAYCVEFSGSPEVSEEGTLVFRFDKLLPRNPDKRPFSGFSQPFKALRKFSSNSAKMNMFFALINGVNLSFGSYFLFKSFTAGIIDSRAARGLYDMTFALFEGLGANPVSLIGIGLGLIPAVFSLLFWSIPLLRALYDRKKNKKIQFENLRKEACQLIWEKGGPVREADLSPRSAASRPPDTAKNLDRIIKELGAYSGVDVSANEQGEICYTFTELKREKEAAEQYRASIDISRSALGETVFDSDG
jgi:hypothetical protein